LIFLIFFTQHVSGFKSSTCDHQKLVDAVMATKTCLVDFVEELLEEERINLSDPIATTAAESALKCSGNFVGCFSLEELAEIMKSPESVLNYLKTDNNCTVEKMETEEKFIEACADKYFQDNKTQTEDEVCKNLGTLTEKCGLERKVGCFSNRENVFKNDLISSVLEDARGIMKMKETKKLMDKNPDFKDMKKYVDCIVGSNSTLYTLKTFLLLLPLSLLYFGSSYEM